MLAIAASARKIAVVDVFVTALGCRLNEAEVDSWTRELSKRGHRLAPSPGEADLAIVNTCAVTAEASRKSRKLISSIHRKNPSAPIVATGCYVSLSPAEAEGLPGVDLVVDNQDKERLIDIASERLELAAMPALAREPDGAHAFKEARTRAFIKVQDGCRNRCTFCVVTLARGNERSRAIDEIVREIHLLVQRGYQEVVLTGVHLGGYGSDLGCDLRDLVHAVLERTDVARLRLSSLEPWDLPADFWTLWRDPRLMPHLHLPLQSGSDTVLKRMARRCPTERYRALVQTLRAHVPDLLLTTDVIVGFPGETDAEWRESLAFVEEIGFSHVHIFSYSPREGTTAARLAGHVRGDVKRQRSKELHQLAAKMKRAHELAEVDRECDVLWEGEGAVTAEGVRYEGYTGNYVRVRTVVPAGAPSLENRVQRVVLEAAEDDGRTRLFGRAITPTPALP